MFMGDFNAIVQWDKRIARTRKTRINAMITQYGTDILGNCQHHMFFFRTVASDRSGINSAVTWIENNDTFAARFFCFRLAVSVTGF